MLMKLDDETYLINETLTFEHESSNFSSKLICGSFGMLPKIINA
jgi:hypothetical protein